MTDQTKAQSPKSKVGQPQGSLPQDLRPELEALRAEVAGLQRSLCEFRGGYQFNGDDSAFLIWVLGFTAGAHLERDGERGERVFARCRDLYVKAFPGAGPLAGGNPS